MKRTDITALFPEATDEQIKSLMDLNGADINNAKKGVTNLQTQLSAAQTRVAELEAKPDGGELKAAQDRAKALQTELDGLKAANTLRDMRANVSKETGVPAELLTGETEEACKAQAKSILEFAKPSGYPTVPDGGEPNITPHNTTRQQFAEWFNQVT